MATPPYIIIISKISIKYNIWIKNHRLITSFGLSKN